MIFLGYSEVMKNNNLVMLAKQNNEEALNEVIKENVNIIHRLINKYNLELGDYKISREDLFQEGLIALYEAISDFDPERNAKFSTFAYKVISRKLFKVYQKEAEVYNEEGYSYSCLDDSDHYYSLKTDYVSDNPVAVYENNCYKDILEQMMSQVDSIDRVILQMRAMSCTYNEIANALSISNKLVDYRIRRLKKRFKDEKDRYLTA